MIADAVIDIGFANASLTAVAQHLGVGHGALYRYIGDRNGMMRAALERLTGRFEWPDLVDDWREVLWNESRAWWTLCERHPGFVTVLAPTPGMPTPMSRRSMRLAVHLHGLGLVGADSLLVVDLVTDTIHDIFHRASQREAVIDQALTMSTEEAAEHIEGVPEEMVEVLLNALIGDPWPWYAQKLELIIDGLAARTASSAG